MGLNPSAAYIGGSNFQNDVATDRVLIATLLGGVSANAGGVWSANDFAITPNSDHSVTVASGKSFVPERTAPSTRGGYFVYNDGNPNDVVQLPVPQAQSYIATILLRVADPTLGTISGVAGARYDIISGAQGSSPTPVSDATIDASYSVPGGWLRLYDIQINPGDTVAVPVGQFTRKVGIAPASPNNPWTNWTPVLSSTGTQPVLGTGGAATGRFTQNGKTVNVSGHVQFGTASYVFGTGTYIITLPVPFVSGTLGPLGPVEIYPGGTFWTPAWAAPSGTQQFVIYAPGSTSSPTAQVSGTTAPGGTAWSASADIRFNFSYEAA